MSAKFHKPNWNANIENQESPKRTETQNTKNRNTTRLNSAKQTLIPKDKMNVELIEKVMIEKKTTSSSPWNHDCKKLREKNVKITLLTNIPTDNITEFVGDRNWGRPEGPLFISYYTEVWGKAPFFSRDCSILSLIRTL